MMKPIVSFLGHIQNQATSLTGSIRDETTRHRTNNSLSTLDNACLTKQLQIGDILFIRISSKPFREISVVTHSWTNHVGIVLATAGNDPLIGESRFPFSGFTSLSRFIARSQQRRLAVARLTTPIRLEQQQQLRAAAARRSNVLYDTGFNLHSRRQFCSRYVREVIYEATGTTIGNIESFAELYTRAPRSALLFWKIWFFGCIPWNRQTVSPASLMQSQHVRLLFDGFISDSDPHSLKKWNHTSGFDDKREQQFLPKRAYRDTHKADDHASNKQ